ncbi:restriction endonuclease subunit S [Sporohalobacter salinus]|uniref:restriction endonuclease subunit S n=1 Tax=Sporohalobacter salinus TaxID=1494606 RepID=UPI0019617475|nr:restriction endonuclease subunit S [Sporohalobacter salinus]MBM7624273.1 restriction endonuclease S subunit [Sporohalobacter salinus]
MKCFSNNAKNLCNRLSVETIIAEDIVKKRFKNPSKYHNVYTLSELVYDVRDGSHQTPIYHEEGVPFISSKDIKPTEIEFGDVKYVSKYLYEKLSGSNPKPEDVLLTKVGTIGVSTVVPDIDDHFSIYVSVAVLKDVFKDKCIPEYLAIYLNSFFTKIQIDKFIKGIGVPDLHLEDIKNIKVIVPKKELQQEIIDFYKRITNKIKKYKNRIKLIYKIFENILYEKVSIKKQSIVEIKKTNSIELDKLKERFDVSFHLKNYDYEVKNSEMDIKKLKEVVWNISSGKRPKGGVKYIKEGVPSLGGEHINLNGEIVYNDMKYVTKRFYKDNPNIKINEMDILICKDGATTGKVAIVNENFKYDLAATNEHLYRISILSEYNAKYIFAILNSDFGQEQIKRYISGGAQGGITLDIFNKIDIPIPSEDIQLEIATKYDQAIKLVNICKKKIKKLEKYRENEIINYINKREI